MGLKLLQRNSMGGGGINPGNILTALNPVGMLSSGAVTNPTAPGEFSGKVGNVATGNPASGPVNDTSGTAQETFGNQVLSSMSGLLPGITKLLSGGGKGSPGAIDTLSGAMKPQPMQIPGITPIESQAGSKIESNLTAGGDPRVLNQINQLTSGDVGTSPVTTQAMDNFKKFTQPDIEQQMALAGLGRSGAAGQAVANASEQAMVPLMQTEIANREAAIPQLQTAGDTATSAALGYGGLTRDIATQAEQAKQNDLTRTTSIAELLLGIPMAGISTAMGGMFTPRTTTGGKGK